ncbi:transposable element Tc1 transposase [Trichonephila clavipes]|nr:transposable element Tc1 transposase [Trichonephila clavipes]
MSEFKRGRIIVLNDARWANRTIAPHMSRSDATTRRFRKESVASDRFHRHDSSGQPRATADQKNRLIVRSAVTAPDSSLSTIIIFSDQFVFELCPDDPRKRVWGHPWQHADHAFTIGRHACPQSGIMVVIRGTLTVQRDVDDIGRSFLLSFFLHYAGVIFQQDDARTHKVRDAMNFITSFQRLPWPARLSK